MAEFGFGTRIGLLENADHRFILDIVNMHAIKIGVYEQWPHLSKIGVANVVGRFLRAISPTVRRSVLWHQDFTEKIITRNRDTRNGILAPLVEGIGRGKPLSGHGREQMLAEVLSTTFTGKNPRYGTVWACKISKASCLASEGHATTISAVQFYLAHNAEIYEKLVGEIRGKYSYGETIGWGTKLASCEYLRACIDEAFRMLPPASGNHWRESEEQGILISGEEIPAGCEVGVSPPALFRSRDIFRDADRFWPERWLKGVLRDDELTTARKALTPFSVGPRNCPGQNAAMMIISVSLACLINRYDFRLGGRPTGEAGVSTYDERADTKVGSELYFQNHFHSCWKEGSFIQFRDRAG